MINTMKAPSKQDIRDALARVEACDDLVEKALLLSGLVNRVFEAAGWPLVVVGGSAVEFYSEGSYMSGDIDLCRQTLTPIPLRQAQDTMVALGATGGPRSWLVAGLYVDLLGLIENEARTPYRVIETPCGPVRIMPPELVLVERCLPACYPQPDPESREIARMLMAVCVSGRTPVDWAEVERLSKLPAFKIADELQTLREDVERELSSDA